MAYGFGMDRLKVSTGGAMMPTVGLGMSSPMDNLPKAQVPMDNLPKVQVADTLMSASTPLQEDPLPAAREPTGLRLVGQRRGKIQGRM